MIITPARDFAANERAQMIAAEQAANPESDIALFYLLFGGDRITCCDEVLVIFDSEANTLPIGACSIAPKGETWDGQTTLVGVYVLSGYRGQSIAGQLVGRAVARCQKRNLNLPVRVDALFPAMRKALAKLSPEVL